MTLVRLLPVIVSALLIAAHFLRQRDVNPAALPLVVVSLAVPFLLLVRKSWAARLVELFLLLAGVVWIRTLFQLVAQRRAEGREWIGVVIILGAVTLFTWASALVFYTRALRERYNLKK